MSGNQAKKNKFRQNFDERGPYLGSCINGKSNIVRSKTLRWLVVRPITRKKNKNISPARTPHPTATNHRYSNAHNAHHSIPNSHQPPVQQCAQRTSLHTQQPPTTGTAMHITHTSRHGLLTHDHISAAYHGMGSNQQQ